MGRDCTVGPCNTQQALSWALGRLDRVRVSGPSMRPTLPPGRTVLFNPRAYSASGPKPGEIVVLEHPDPARQGMLLVKRVAEIAPGGAVVVVGDDPSASTDSRHYGPVSPERVRGRVECMFP